jgi:hypothetical protein
MMEAINNRFLHCSYVTKWLSYEHEIFDEYCRCAIQRRPRNRWRDEVLLMQRIKSEELDISRKRQKSVI